MVKRVNKDKLKALKDDPRFQKALLPILIVSCSVVVIVTIWSIIAMPKSSPGTRNGYGADGFHAYTEDGTDLGVKTVVDKDQVVIALGSKAKSVGDAQIDKVFNLNEDRGQTLTFPFVRNDGVAASLYIDKWQYKSKESMDKNHIYVATKTAGTVNGYPAYYRFTQAIGGDREFHMMVVKGLTAYRFVVAQPVEKVTISEIDAVAILKKLALHSNL